MMAPVDTVLGAVVRRDRVVVVILLAAVLALSWAYLLAGAGILVLVILLEVGKHHANARLWPIAAVG